MLNAEAPVIAGYLPSWAMADYDLSKLKPATDVLYFSIQPNANGTLNLDDIDQTYIPKLRQAKARYGFRLLICCGGWERSAGFYPMASDNAKRTKFVNAALSFCQTKGFDGIDLDWEHPANQTQAVAYGLLIRDLHLAFKPSGRIVTAAIADWQPMDSVGVKNLDRVHLMSYDHEGKHSTLVDAKKDVQKMKDLGFPSKKIVLGVPFYGRSLTNGNSEKTYRDIVTDYNPPADADEAGGFYFNGRSTMQEKADYIKKQKLGGVMIWELTQDAPGAKSLLKTLFDALNL